MCGIGGILRVHRPGEVPAPEVAIPEAWLDVIDEAVKHRGPDGRGRFRDRVTRAEGCVVDVALVHRRLSIIDHEGGWQPMVQGGTALLSREGEPYGKTACHVCPRCAERKGGSASFLAVVFNGCIYNHRVLRRELQSAGHVFATDHSDTEVLLHGYREWGEGFPARLGGMFALGLWDGATGQSLVARDLAGEKPLYEAVLPDGVYVFASTHGGVFGVLRELERARPGAAMHELKPSAQGLAQWLRFGGSVIGPISGIDEVEPRITSVFCRHDRGDGEMVEATSRGYYEELPGTRDGRAMVDVVDEAIGRAVGTQLEADVALGFFLSGGVDSSLVARHAAARAGKVRTYCVRMPDARYDESTHAAEVARAIGSEHETLECEARPAEHLLMLIAQLGLPFGDSSLLPTHWVSAAARRAVKVAVSGDGGDELFWGYQRHVMGRRLAKRRDFSQLLPPWIDRGAHAASVRVKLARLGRAARHGYEELTAIFGFDQLRALMPSTRRMVMQERFPEDTARYDFEHYLPDDLLRKTDTASMAVALEVRAPLLSREVVRLGLSTSVKDLLAGGQRKGLLRAVARKYFPSRIVDRPKQGFAIPIGEWFRTDYGGMRQLLLDHLESAEPWGSPALGIDLNMKFVRRMLEEHMGGRRDHSQRLYMLLVLSIWAKGLGK